MALGAVECGMGIAGICACHSHGMIGVWWSGCILLFEKGVLDTLYRSSPTSLPPLPSFTLP